MTDHVQLLTFVVAGDEYGVDILRVQEIRGWSAPMPLPTMPHYVKGVINLRGEVVALADLRERLGLPLIDYGATTVVVLLRVFAGTDAYVVGVIVDAMSEVTEVPEAVIKAPPALRTANGVRLATGIATLEKKMITILDVDRIFDLVDQESIAKAAA